jgi:hypothetical protein
MVAEDHFMPRSIDPSIDPSVAVLMCLMLLCTWMSVVHAQPTTFVENDDDQANLEKSFINPYPAMLHARLNADSALDDLLYHSKSYNAEQLPLAKRLIMLPRVGRRSV